jgi:hypothetical protein
MAAIAQYFCSLNFGRIGRAEKKIGFPGREANVKEAWAGYFNHHIFP